MVAPSTQGANSAERLPPFRCPCAPRGGPARTGAGQKSAARKRGAAAGGGRGHNAAKYGAPSVEGGQVSITWRRLGTEPERLQPRWSETGGPLVEGPPTRRGFGSRVLTGTVGRN